MNIKTLALYLAFMSPLTVNANNMINFLDLSKKSHQLSIRLEKLSIIEQVKFCKKKILNAAQAMELAAQYLINEDIFFSKYDLKEARGSLAYSVVEQCTEANSIASAKNEIDQIINLIG